MVPVGEDSGEERLEGGEGRLVDNKSGKGGG